MEIYLRKLKDYLIKEQGYDENVVEKMDYVELLDLYEMYTEDGA